MTQYASGGFAVQPSRMPVTLYYVDDQTAERFAKGGLADEASAIRKAGRHGDTEIIHINKDELKELIEMWGEPTINPETGMPEFFIKKLWKGVKKVVKPIAPFLPMAVALIPGVGPIASIALQAGAGALAGGATGGVKGALMGGISGGLGASGAAGALGGKILGASASQAARAAAGNALIQGGLAAASGGNPLTAAAMGAAQGALSARFAPKPAVPAPTSAPPAEAGYPMHNNGGTGGPFEAVPTAAAPNPVSPVPTERFNKAFSNLDFLYDDVPASIFPAIATDAAAPATTAAVVPAADPAKKLGFLNRNFLGLKGVPNKIGIPLSLAMLAILAERQKGGGDDDEDPWMTQWANGPPGFGGGLPSLKGQFARFAARGGPSARPLKNVTPRMASGPGTGRSDDIPAMLSDGEYVIDAETVALLGDGSTRAGAKKLDDFRVKVRRHKGRQLARGKFSHKAKSPERYMGGRA